ncbi:Hint domain-containing protein [Phaeobacter sp. HS012]|uniref:Hint domain-containing protein n=1 Tax=unclassified Phaeobacter TaxID=2621772 RepID=UPI001B37F33F|nr:MULTISPECIES: Hint domain-containing protein [unclassified Phaeobacter]MBQ4809008.1 Hint domain-containing protein [Phaeobacter sp. HS012]MBQ4883858.1 Hint domain-containing protein [Phaeobacter sp. HS011]
MPQYTVTAFRWSGTGYNAQYNTSYTATLDDDDASYQGGGDGNESISINGGAFGGSAGTPYAINVSFTDTGGTAHIETFYFFNTGGNWYFVPGPDSEFTVGATLGSYQNHTSGWNYSNITCFARGTLIETDRGRIVVEALVAGDRVLVADGSYRPLRMVMSRKLSAAEVADNPKLRPVRITAGALGHGLPERDLLVSRQHRMLVSSKISERMFVAPEVLVAAVRLTELPGIFVEPSGEPVEYFHLLCDQHEVIFAEGAPTESLFTGAEALKALSPEAYEEITLLFPELLATQAAARSACPIPSGRQQRQLVARHLKNNKPILGCAPTGAP